MGQSVLNLGEKIVLAARLAAVEHIRQEIEDAWQAKSAGPVPEGAVLVSADAEMVPSLALTDEPDEVLVRPVDKLLGEVFRKIEKGAA